MKIYVIDDAYSVSAWYILKANSLREAMDILKNQGYTPGDNSYSFSEDFLNSGNIGHI